MDRFQVVPSLGQLTGQEIKRFSQVTPNFLLGQRVDPDALAEPRVLLNSEPNRAHQFLDLIFDGLCVCDLHRDFTDRGDVPPDGSGDVLGDRVRNQQHVVFTGPFLDFLGVSVELFQIIKGLEVDGLLLGLVDVVHSSDQAHFHVGSARIVQLASGVESLVFVGVIIPEHDLKVDGLDEFSLFSFAEDFGDSFTNSVTGDFRHL